MTHLLLLAAAARAHGTSDLGGRFDVTGPGVPATLVVSLQEFAPGAARGLQLEARIDAAGTEQRIDLAPSGDLRWSGRFDQGSGTHGLRIFATRGEQREVALGGFTPGNPVESELFFVPTGALDPIPMLEHGSGILAAAALVTAIARTSARPQAAVQTGGAPLAAILVGALGALAMPLGAYWDVAFHLEQGREGLFSPPHLVIYGGIFAALSAAASALAVNARALGLRTALTADPALGAAVAAAVITLASAPLDEFWHGLFGLDASIWSPPHAILIFGAYGLCMALAASRVAGAATQVAASRIALLAGAMLIAELFLAEFEFTLPTWHISQARPMAAQVAILLLSALLVGILARRSVPWRWAATSALGGWLVLRLGLTALLVLAAAPLPAIPVWLPAFLLVGVAVDRGLHVRTWLLLRGDRVGSAPE